MNTLDKQKNFLYTKSAGNLPEPSKQENLLKFAKNNLIVSPLVPYKHEDRMESIITPHQNMSYDQLDRILPQYLTQSKTGAVDDELEDMVDIGLGLINNVTPDVARMNRDTYINQFFGRDVDNQGFLSAMWDGMKSYGEQKKLAKLVNQFDSTEDGDYKNFLKEKIDNMQIDMDKNRDFTARNFVADLFVQSAPVIAQSAESLIASTILGYFGGKLATMFGSTVNANNYISSIKYIDNAKKASYFKGYFKRKARKAGEAWANPVGFFTANGKQLGAKLGTAINTAANTYQVERGLASYEMYQNGITNDAIRNRYADTIGLINSFIEVVTIDPFMGREQLGKKIRKFSLYDILNYGNKTGAFTKGVVDFAFDSAISTFDESLEEGLQGATETYFAEIAKELNDKGESDKFSGEKLLKAYEQFNNSFKEALGPSAVLGLMGASFSSITSTVGDTASANKFFKNAKNSKVVDIENINIDVTAKSDIDAINMYIKNKVDKESTKNIDDKKSRKAEEKKTKQEQLLDPIRVYQDRDGSFTPISPKDNVTALLANYNNASGVRVIVYDHSNFRPANRSSISSKAKTAPRKMMESMIEDMGFERRGDIFIATDEVAKDENYRDALNKLDEYAMEDIFTMPYGGQVYTFKDSAGLPYRIYIAQNDSMWQEEKAMVEDTLQRTKDYYTRAVDDIKMVTTSDELDNVKYDSGNTYGYVVNEATTAEQLISGVTNAVANAYNNKKTNTTKVDNKQLKTDVTTFIETGKFDSKDKAYAKLVKESAQKIHNVLFANMYTLEDAMDYFTDYDSDFKKEVEQELTKNKNAIFRNEGYESVSDEAWEIRSEELKADREAIKTYIKADSEGIFNNENNESISDAMAIFVQMTASKSGMTGEKWLKKHGFEFKQETDNKNYTGTTSIERSKKGNISKILIRATTSADLSTFEHEMIHAIFAINDGNIKKEFSEIFKRIKDDANFKQYLKEHKQIFRDPRFQTPTFSYDKLFDNWTNDEDEFVAYLYEAYRSDEIYNDKKLNTFFKRVKNFFKKFVHALRGTVKLNDEVIDFYEGLFNTDILNYALYNTKREMMQGITNEYRGITEEARRASSARAKMNKIASNVQKALKIGGVNDIVDDYATLLINLSDAENYSYITDSVDSKEAEEDISKLISSISRTNSDVPKILAGFITDKIESSGQKADEGYVNSFVNMFADSLRKDNVISYDTQNEIQKAYPMNEQAVFESDLDSTELHQTTSDKIAIDWLKSEDTSISSFIENAFITNKTPEMREIEEDAKADGTFMLAPNGEKSNLNEHQWLQVRTERFKKWFGDWEDHPNSRYTSKMLDKNGEPQVFYHGTSNVFAKFNIGGKNRAFFSNDPRIASSYGGGNILDIERAMKEGIVDKPHVIPCFLKITSPDVVEGNGNSWKNLTGESDKTIYALETDEDVFEYYSEDERKAKIAELEKEGTEYTTYEGDITPETVSTDSYIDNVLDKNEHDGVVFDNIIDLDTTEHADAEYTSTVVAVTANSNQIKHAMQNDGTYSVSGNMLAQTVFHGTPYVIKSFDTSKIGTGEGTHVYGWGLYFSQKYGIAESYTDIISKQNKEFESSKYIYSVDVPDDTGENYLDWYLNVPRKLYNTVVKEFSEYDDVNFFNKNQKFGDFYETLANFLFDNINDNEEGDKQASIWLRQHGYTGIKQQIGSGHFGWKEENNVDGNFNLIIFDDKDIHIKNRRDLVTNVVEDYEQDLLQTAFHGTPYIIDFFDSTKIGSGEGAQAYGWGLYFSQKYGVAEDYAYDITNYRNNSVAIKPEEQKRVDELNEYVNDINVQYEEWTDFYDFYMELGYIPGNSPKKTYKLLKRGHEYIRESINSLINSSYVSDDFKEKLIPFEVALMYASDNTERISYLMKHQTEYNDIIKGLEEALSDKFRESEEKVLERNEKVEPYLNEINKIYEDINNRKVELEPNLYTVEVPDDTGENYIDWYGETPYKIYEKLLDSGFSEYVIDKGKEAFWREYVDGKAPDFNEFYRYMEETINMDTELSEANKDKTYDEIKFTGDKQFSEWLHSIGYAGIKQQIGSGSWGYDPSRNRDGNFNLIIFNDQDIQIKSRKNLITNEIEEYFEANLSELFDGDLHQMVFADEETPTLTSEDADRARQFMDEMDTMALRFDNNDFTGYKATNSYENQIINGLSKIQKYLSNSNSTQLDDVIGSIDALEKEYERLVQKDIFYNAKNDKDKIESRELARQAKDVIDDIKKVLMVTSGQKKHGTLSDNRVVNEELVNYEALKDYIFDKNRQREYFEYLQDSSKRGDRQSFRERMDNAKKSANEMMNDEAKRADAIKEFENFAPTFLDKGKFMARHMLEDAIAEFTSKVSINALVQGLLMGYVTTDRKSTLQAIVEVQDKLGEMDNRLADWEEPLFNFEKIWTDPNKKGLHFSKAQFNKIKTNLNTLSEMNRKQIATFLNNSVGIDLGTTPVFSEYYELLGMFNTNIEKKNMVAKIMKATDGSLLNEYILDAYGTDNAVEAYDKFYDDLKASHKKYHDIMADKKKYAEYFKKVFGERAESEFAKKPYLKDQQDKIAEVFYELSLNKSRSYKDKMAIISRKIKELKIKKTGNANQLNEKLSLTIWQMFNDMNDDIEERIYLDSARMELFRKFKGNVSPDYSTKHLIERIYDFAHSYPLGQGHMQYYDRLYKIADVLGHIDSMVNDNDYKHKAHDDIFAHNLPSRIRRGVIKKISQNVSTLSEFYDLVNTIRRPVREVSIGDTTTKMVDHLKSIITAIDFANEDNMPELNTSDIEVILRDLNYVFNKLGSKELVEKSTAYALVAGDANVLIDYFKYYKQKKEDEAHKAMDISLAKTKVEVLIKEVEELGRVYDAKIDYKTREYNKQYFKGNMNEIFNSIKALKKNENPTVEDISRIRELMYQSQKAVFTTLLRSLDETMDATTDSLKKLGLNEMDIQMMRYYLTMPEADVEAVDKIFLTEEERNKDREYFQSNRDITTTADIMSAMREITNLYNSEKLQALANEKDSKQRQLNEEKQTNRELYTKLRVFKNATSKIASERDWAIKKMAEIKDKYELTKDELDVANWMIGQYDKEYTSLEAINKKLKDVIANLEEGVKVQSDVIKKTEDELNKVQNAYKSELDKIGSENMKEINRVLSDRLKKLVSKATVNGDSAVMGKFIPVLEWIFTTLGFEPQISEIEFYTKAGEILKGKAEDTTLVRKSDQKGSVPNSLFDGDDSEIIAMIDKPEYKAILDKKIDKSLRRDYSLAKVINMGIPYYKTTGETNDAYGWSYSQRKKMHEIFMEADYFDSPFAELYNGYFTFEGEDVFNSEYFNFVRKPNFTYTDQEVASVIMNRHTLEKTEHGRRVIDDIIHVLIDGKGVDPVSKDAFLKPLRKYETVLNEFRQDEYGETVYDEDGNPIRKKQRKFYQDIYVEREEGEADVTLRDVLLKDKKTFVQYTAPEKAQLIELINAMERDSRAEYKAEQDKRELRNFEISNKLASEIAFKADDNSYKGYYSDTDDFLRILSVGTKNNNMLKTHLGLVGEDINPLEGTDSLDTFWVKREIGNANDAVYKKALEYLLDFLTTGNEASLDASSTYLKVLYQNNYKVINSDIKSETDAERLKKFLKNSRFGFEKPQRLATRLGDTARELLVRRAWKCQNEETLHVNERLKAFSNKIDSLGFGKGELFNILKEKVKVGEKEMYYTTYHYDEDRNVKSSTTAELTYENLMSIYIYSKSMAGLEKMKGGKGNNFSEESILDVVNFMEDEGNETASKLKELADWMIVDFKNEFPRLNQKSLEADNVPLEKRNGYFPQKSQIGEYSIGKTVKGTIYTKVKVADDMTYLLSDTIYPLNLNAISTYIGGVQAHEHYMAFAEYAKDLDSILDKGNIKELVQMKFGNDTLRQLKDYVDRIKQAPISDLSDGERVFMKVLNNVATAKLAGSLTTVTKQILSAITAWANGQAGFMDIMKNLVYFLSHPDDSFIEDTVYKYDPSMMQRTAEYAVKQLSEGRDFLVKSKVGEIRDVMMKPIQYMDKATALAVWKSVYDKALSEGESIEDASFKAQQIVQETQSTGENLSMASLQTTKNPIVKLAMLFTNDLFQIWNILFSDVPMDISNREFGKAIKKLTGVALLGTMMALLSGGWIPDEGDDEFDWKTFLKDMSMEFAEMGIPIAGPEVADLMSGWSRSVFSLPQEIIQMPKNFAKIPERTFEENIEQFYDMFASGAELTGAPVVGFKRVAKAGYNTIMNKDLRDLLYIFGKRWGEGWDD